MNQAQIREGLDYLASIDPDIARAVVQLGPPAPRLRPAGFETFLATIISQQISTEASSAIMGRVRGLLPQLDAESLLAQSPQALRDAGLSGRKVEYARGLAEAVLSGGFDMAGLAQLDDAAAIASITRLRGFGRWSAEIYLMFSLRRQDIFPADDLALQVALGRLKALAEKPTAGQARKMVAHWAPWRSVGALFLWHFYRGAPT